MQTGIVAYDVVTHTFDVCLGDALGPVLARFRATPRGRTEAIAFLHLCLS